MVKKERKQQEESACRRKGVACGACCGPFNLDFVALGEASGNPAAGEPGALPLNLSELLHEREREFLAVDKSRRDAVLAYRHDREAREAAIPRHDPGIYVCPFFGPVPPGRGAASHARPGCMIHPILMGQENSQNYSFYGASICQGYDCQNKEADESGDYARTLSEITNGPEEYTRLMGDVILHKTLRKIPGLLEGLDAAETRALFIRVCRARLQTAASRRVTSFEITMRPFPGLRAELEALLLEESEGDSQDVRALIAELTGFASPDG